jgi:hypothetical protein
MRTVEKLDAFCLADSGESNRAFRIGARLPLRSSDSSALIVGSTMNQINRLEGRQVPSNEFLDAQRGPPREMLDIIIGACSNAVLAVDGYRPDVLGKIGWQSGKMRQHLLKVTNKPSHICLNKITQQPR